MYTNLRSWSITITSTCVQQKLFNELCINLNFPGGKPKLQDRDAVLIRRSWFRSEDKITVEKIANLEECDEYGLTEVADVLL